MSLPDRKALTSRAVGADDNCWPSGRRTRSRASFVLQNIFGAQFGALVCGVLILWQDFGGLSTLIGQSDDRTLGLGLLFFALSGGLWILGIALGVSLPTDEEFRTSRLFERR